MSIAALVFALPAARQTESAAVPTKVGSAATGDGFIAP
jgi:hypothetical protein